MREREIVWVNRGEWGTEGGREGKQVDRGKGKEGEWGIKQNNREES